MMKFIFILIALGTVVLYRPVLTADSLLSLDDIRGVTPLQDVHSVADYFHLRDQERIWDVQPVRDFSYWIDYQIKDRWPAFPSFHAFNILLWLGILGGTARLFLLLNWSETLAASLLLLMAFHPAFVNAMAWVSARKHLLAAFFLVCATVQVVRTQKQRSSWTWIRAGLLTVLYVLALFSHPISLFWIVWAFLFWRAYGGIGHAKIPLLLCAAASVFCVVLNLNHYNTTYLAQTAGVAKFSSFSWSHLSEIVLSLGRYFWLLIWPQHLLVFYYGPDDAANVWGLILLALAVAALRRSKWREPRFFIWLAYFIGPLLLATIPKTNIFASDTYLIVPALGFFAYLGTVLTETTKKKSLLTQRILPTAVALLLIPMIVKANSQVKRWISDNDFCEQMYFEAPNPQVMTCYGMDLVSEGKSADALRVAQEIGRMAPEYRGYPELLAKAVGIQPQLTLDQKIQILEKAGVTSNGFSYSLAQLYAQEKNFQKARKLMVDAISLKPAVFAYELKENLETVLADTAFYCQQSGAPCEKEIQTVRDNFHYRDWDEKAYEIRLRSDGAGL